MFTSVKDHYTTLHKILQCISKVDRTDTHKKYIQANKYLKSLEREIERERNTIFIISMEVIRNTFIFSMEVMTLYPHNKSIKVPHELFLRHAAVTIILRDGGIMQYQPTEK